VAHIISYIHHRKNMCIQCSTIIRVEFMHILQRFSTLAVLTIFRCINGHGYNQLLIHFCSVCPENKSDVRFGMYSILSVIQYMY
jgi:hypothetical protein